VTPAKARKPVRTAPNGTIRAPRGTIERWGSGLVNQPIE
jgi:hypothetical protein